MQINNSLGFAMLEQWQRKIYIFCFYYYYVFSLWIVNNPKSFRAKCWIADVRKSILRMVKSFTAFEVFLCTRFFLCNFRYVPAHVSISDLYKLRFQIVFWMVFSYLFHNLCLAEGICYPTTSYGIACNSIRCPIDGRRMHDLTSTRSGGVNNVWLSSSRK